MLLGNFYDRILFSRSGGVLRDADDARAHARRAFIEMMTINRGPVGKAPLTALNRQPERGRGSQRTGSSSTGCGAGAGSGRSASPRSWNGSAAATTGAQLVTQASTAGEKGIEWVLKDVAQKFDAFGAEASEYFESRARLLSVIVGFVLAFAINVNALALFETFMKRPDVTEAVIARGESVTQSYEDAAEAGGRAQRVGTGGHRRKKRARACRQRAADDAAAAVRRACSRPACRSAGMHRALPTSGGRRPLSLVGLAAGRPADRTRRPVLGTRRVQTLTGVRCVFTQRKDGAESAAAATTAAAAAPRRRTEPGAEHANRRLSRGAGSHAGNRRS